MRHPPLRMAIVGFVTTLAICSAALPVGAVLRTTPISRSGTMTDWPRYRFDLANTGYNPYERILSRSNVGSLVEKWSFFSDHRFDVDAEVSNGIVLAASVRHLMAFDVATGHELWIYRRHKDLNDPVTVANGVLYADFSDGFVALDLATGHVLWKVSRGAFHSAPAVTNGIVYEGTAALDASNGNLLWTIAPDGTMASSPAIVGGVEYVGTDTGSLDAFDATNDTKLWSFRIPSGHERDRRFSSPAVVDGVVYAATALGDLFAFDANSGAVLWHDAFALSPHVSSPAVANGVVYDVVDGDGYLYALDATTGAERWGVAACARRASPAVANGVVYVGGCAFDARNGKQLWSGGESSYASPAVSNGMVFLASGYSLRVFGL